MSDPTPPDTSDYTPKVMRHLLATEFQINDPPVMTNDENAQCLEWMRYRVARHEAKIARR